MEFPSWASSRWRWLGLLVLAIALASGAWADSRDAVLTVDEGLVDRTVAPSGWRLGMGDDSAWADPEFDDSAWPVVAALDFRRGQTLPGGWGGVAWLRCRIEVSAAMVGQPMALQISQTGALQVFLDGDLISSIGHIATRPDGVIDIAASEPAMSSIPTILTFGQAGDHVLAVRYVNPAVPSLLRATGRTTVSLLLSRADTGIESALYVARFRSLSLGGFCGLFLTFGLLHLLLYLFYPTIRANLDFALLCFVLGGMVFFLTYRWIQTDPSFLAVSERAMNLLGLSLGVLSIRFVYRVFYDHTPRFFVVYALLAVPIAVWGLVTPDAALTTVFLYMLVSTAELMRVVVVALVRGKPGARVIGAGAFSLALGFTIGLLANMGVLPSSQFTRFLLPFSSMGVLLLCMSVYLSKRFAAVHRDLEARLVEVERLSAEKLDNERRQRAEAVERGVLEERYEQKVRELEDARQLQLSMLPRSLPDLPDLDIAVHMQTATEVGGDYYDFELDGDGGLILAIGDATGHGMRAGTMVTAAKSLFNVLAAEYSPVDTLSRSTRAIKRMNLRKLAMALTLARYRHGRLKLSAAGMPPALIYRAASGDIEQVTLNGMPLGAMASFPYLEAEVGIDVDDAILLMSDGFPERLNPDGDLLGYDRTIECFAELAMGSAAEIIAGLLREEDSWAGGTTADDDVTFVVLKRQSLEVTPEAGS